MLTYVVIHLALAPWRLSRRESKGSVREKPKGTPAPQIRGVWSQPLNSAEFFAKYSGASRCLEGTLRLPQRMTRSRGRGLLTFVKVSQG